jgi:ribA/ribD-fused uncharacterized protein
MNGIINLFCYKMSRKDKPRRKEVSSTTAREIRFFGKDGKYSLFSNFAHTPLEIGGLSYATSEHYFQSSKFADTDPEYAEKVRLAKTPHESKNLGKSKAHRIHPHWGGMEGESIRTMRRVLFCKALQNKEFRDLLLSTGNAKIIEASPWDKFWGEGKDKTGKNMLGKMLEELRDRLRHFGDNIYTE